MKDALKHAPREAQSKRVHVANELCTIHLFVDLRIMRIRIQQDDIEC